MVGLHTPAATPAPELEGTTPTKRLFSQFDAIAQSDATSAAAPDTSTKSAIRRRKG
jgi:hypothetical protein